MAEQPSPPDSGELEVRLIAVSESTVDYSPPPEPARIKAEMGSFEKATILWARLAVFMSAVAALFICLQWREMRTGGQDTHALAEAAKIQSEQAIQQTERMGASLTRMEQLVGATSDLGAQARRSGDIAKQALSAAVAADRPWIGILWDTPGEPMKPSTLKITAINTGKSAARITKFQMTEMSYPTFPQNPMYVLSPGEKKLSQLLMVPNTSATLQMTSIPIADSEMKILEHGDAGLYIYAVAEYTDVRTHESHRTRACVVYIPALKVFGACPQYNDAN